MKRLTSKQHLFMRVILVVTLANAAIFYNIFLNRQVLTANGAKSASLTTQNQLRKADKA
jgi:hypothetical protein